jgi:hypothetical protein
LRAQFAALAAGEADYGFGGLSPPCFFALWKVN